MLRGNSRLIGEQHYDGTGDVTNRFHRKGERGAEASGIVVVDDHEPMFRLAGRTHGLVVVTDDEQAVVLADIVGDLNGVLDQ